MNFPPGLFTDAWALAAWLALALAWLWCVKNANWQRLADPGQLNVWLGACVVLTLFWSMLAGAHPGLYLHLLGATVLTLMFGPPLAILALSVALAAATLNAVGVEPAHWQSYSLNALVFAVFPCFVAQVLLRCVARWLPANFFCYIFCAAFFGAALAALATGGLATVLLWAAGIYPAELLWSEYLSYYLLLGFSEAWLNGAAITLMVVYYPHWVGSFDDRRYPINKSLE